METPRSRYRTLLAVSTAAILISSSGCHALGLMGHLTPGGGGSGLTPPGPQTRAPGVLANAGDSIFPVVAWAMAVVLGSLALAFVARLLNGRPSDKISPGPRLSQDS